MTCERCKELERIVKSMFDYRYMSCGFRTEDGMPCGCCEMCEYTTRTSAEATIALKSTESLNEPEEH